MTETNKDTENKIKRESNSKVEKTTVIAGRFVNDTGIFTGQVEIQNGVITKVDSYIREPDFAYGADHLIFPGIIDVHIHAREDETGKQCYKEDYTTAAQAAQNGGIVCCAAMPNTPNPLTTDEQLIWHRTRTKGEPITFIHYAGIGPDTVPIRAHVPYKVYTGPSVGTLFFRSEQELRRALQRYRGMNVSFHVEDFDVLKASKDGRTHRDRRPREAVNTALRYVLSIIEEFNLRAKLCHWSTGGESLELIRAHRQKGHRTLLEVSPLHLFYNADEIEHREEHWPLRQMNPALQSEKDQTEIIEALRSGFIDIIATDHAPHTLDEKYKNFASLAGANISTPEEIFNTTLLTEPDECRRIACKNGTSGTPQLDTYGLIITWLMAKHRFTPEQIARCTAARPGAWVNQFRDNEPKLGRIEKGYEGSLTVINTKEPLVLERDYLLTKVKWSPFESVEFPGRVKATFVKGRRVLPAYEKKFK